MLSTLDLAISKTLIYGKKYGVTYGKNEIFYRLIGQNIYSRKMVFQRLNANPTLKKAGINPNYLKKMTLAKLMAKRLAEKFEDILLIGITGSVAAGYPNKSDDIDLLIIVKKDKLWITRLRIRLYVLLNKIPHRKYGQKQKENELCFNLWLDEEALELPKTKRNLKNGMDLILMKPVINVENTYQKFIYMNQWVNQYLATGYQEIVKKFPRKKLINSDFEKNINFFDKLINWLIFWPQYWYMKSKIGEGIIDRKRAFFHPEANK